jgi:hypothetical protein
MKKYVVNTKQAISEDTEGETVVINLETGSYYNLNSEASKIWAHLIKGVDIDILKTKLKPVNATANTNAKVDEFIEKLVAENLITQTEIANSSPDSDINIDVENIVIETYTDMQDLLGLDPIHEVEEEAGWPLAKKS